MHALIVHCHPEPRSFNATLRDIARDTLRRRGCTVEVSDLYAEGFEPVEGPARYAERADPALFAPLVEQRRAWQTGTLPADVRREIERLERADLLVLQFPLWWHGPPAMLKGWFDRVFVSGGLYTGNPLNNDSRPRWCLRSDRARRAAQCRSTSTAKWRNAAMALRRRQPFGLGRFWPLAVLRHRPDSGNYRTGTAPTQLPKPTRARSRIIVQRVPGRMRYDRGYFRGRRALCALTSGAPAEVFGPDARGGDLQRMLYPIQYSLYYMGYSVLPAFHADGIPGHGFGAADDARLRRHQRAWARRLETLDESAVIDFPGWDDWDASGRARAAAAAARP